MKAHPRAKRRLSFTLVDNKYTQLKTGIRLALVDALGKRDIKVLDAYSGQGVMWKEIRAARPDVKFHITSIDQKITGRTDVIRGNNLNIMPSLPLSEFDIIDLDAYGQPTEQLALVAELAPNVPVVVTVIQTNIGTTPYKVLQSIGIPPQWEEEVRQVFRNVGPTDLWDQYCASLGYVRRIGYTVRKEIGPKRYDVLLSAKTPAPLQRSGAWSNL